jgi:hypothetical protein
LNALPKRAGRYVFFWRFVEFFAIHHHRHGAVTEICDSSGARSDGAGTPGGLHPRASCEPSFLGRNRRIADNLQSVGGTGREKQAAWSAADVRSHTHRVSPSNLVFAFGE